jgi:hypothetical protein
MSCPTVEFGERIRPERVRNWVALTLTLAFFVGCVGIVRADPFGVGPPAAGFFPDNATHTNCMTASIVDEGLVGVARWAMDNSLEPTDMIVTEDDACYSYTDVWWFEDDLGAGTRGRWECWDLSTNGDVCLSANVLLNKTELDQGPYDYEDRRKTACHELGHSVGLEHGNGKNDCMVNGAIEDVDPNDPTDPKWRHYGNHHKDDHINAMW